MRWPRLRRSSVTAAATVLQGPAPEEQRVSEAGLDQVDLRRHLYRTPDEWQRECWDFYDSLGEFRQGITWKANMLSRVRLRAARKVPGQDEPEIAADGTANDLVRELAGGVGGQSQLMSSFAVYLDVPGECYMVGETLPSGRNTWYTRSIEEMRPTYLEQGVQWTIAEGFGRWRKLPDSSLVVRVYRAHRRWNNVADAPAKAARPLMRELELINRHIQSQYLSRLASAGVIIFPDEITFPVRPEFADAPDPFVAEWIEIAAEAIKTPGTASAIVPIPIKVPGEYVDKVKHVDFTLKLDDQIIQKRDSALTRLAISLDMPAEALLGTADVNHWNAWLIDEQGVKIHIAPDAEIVCDALTTGYLMPRLKAAREAGDDVDPEEWVVWYDASELVLRPDRSKNAFELFDRNEINGHALRRESGFDDSDRPTDTERRDQLLVQVVAQPVNAWPALSELGYVDAPSAAELPEGGDGGDGLQPAPAPEDQHPRETVGPPAQNPAPTRQAPAHEQADVRERLINQAKLEHALKIEFDGAWRLYHPRECRDHLFSCPVTHATWTAQLLALPGASGAYACWLNAHSQPILGAQMPAGRLLDMFESTLVTAHSKELITNGNGSH